MKFICEKKDIFPAVTVAYRFCNNKKNVIPVLSGIRFSLQGNTLTLAASNLETAVETNLQVQGMDDGGTVIPGISLVQLIARLPDGKIGFSLEKDKNIIKVTSNGSEYELYGMPPEEFPPFPRIDEQNKYVLPQKELKLMAKQSIYAASNDDVRPIFTGCLIEVDGGNIRFVASDTYRLAYRETCLETEMPSLWVTVPAKTINEIAKLCKDEDGQVEFAYGSNQTMFRINNSTMVARVIDGYFPDYRKVLPKSYQTKAVVSRKTMLETVNRVSLFAASYNNAVHLNFNCEGLTVTAIGDYGQAKEAVSCEVDGPEVSVAFNYRYLIEGLRAAEGEKIEIRLNDPQSPAEFRDTSDPAFFYLLLPMRVQSC